MRLIDADALIDDAMDRYCKDCDKRKGIKRGKWKIIYEIGDVPCRACDVDDMINDLENAPTITPDMAQVIAYECGKDSVERKKGKWRLAAKPTDSFAGYRCSECNELVYGKTNYCPRCGADMRGESNA